MAVSFLTAAQRDRYGRYPHVVTPNDLARCFHLSDDDRVQIMSCRGHHNRLRDFSASPGAIWSNVLRDDPIGRLSDSGVNENHDHRIRFLAPIRAISAHLGILRLLEKSETFVGLNPP